MEKNKYYCPNCGEEMYKKYDKPALNLICPKCGCKIASTEWDKIDLDETKYEIFILPVSNPTLNQIKIVSKITGKNYLSAKDAIISGFILFKGKAINAKEIIALLKKNSFNYNISPTFPY